jgi:hypothetical protein
MDFGLVIYFFEDFFILLLHFALFLTEFLLVLSGYLFDCLKLLIQFNSLFSDLFLEFNLALNLILELRFNLKIGKLMIAIITDLVWLLVHLRQPSVILRTSITNVATTAIAVVSFLAHLV